MSGIIGRVRDERAAGGFALVARGFVRAASHAIHAACTIRGRCSRSRAIEHFADRLTAACRAKGAAVCVGLDPVLQRLPASLRAGATGVAAVSGSSGGSGASGGAQAAAEAIGRFCRDVLGALAAHVPCVKIQSACFERYLWHGVRVYYELIRHAQSLGLVVIGDAKRGDIGASSGHYAAGCLSDPVFDDAGSAAGPDALTVNAYFGPDGLAPFIDAAAASGKGLFALVRTSNPGGDALQTLKLADGRSVSEAVAQMVASLGCGAALVGRSGYSLLGAVVGATKAQDAARLRQLMPQQIFLVPGFGAQGGGADDVKACFKPDGSGAIVTASRSVLYAYEKRSGDWLKAVEDAAIEMKAQVNAVMP